MSGADEIGRIYGQRRLVLRFRIEITDHDAFSNRDLLSIAHVVDAATRAAIRDVILQLAYELELEPAQARAVGRKLDNLPAAAFEIGELVEFRQGSWRIVLDLPDTGIVLLLLYLLRITLGRDIEAVWSGTRASARFRELLATRVPEALATAAQRAAERFRRAGTLGSRHSIDATDVEPIDRGREMQLLIRARRSGIIRPLDEIE